MRPQSVRRLIQQLQASNPGIVSKGLDASRPCALNQAAAFSSASQTQPKSSSKGTTLIAAATALAGAGGAWLYLQGTATQKQSTSSQKQPENPEEAIRADPLVAAALANASEDARGESPSSASSSASGGANGASNAPEPVNLPPLVASLPSEIAGTNSASGLPKEGPWVTDEALATEIQKRATADNRLRGYMHLKQREVQTQLDQMQMMGRRIEKDEFEAMMRAIEDEVNLQTNLILYGIADPNARRNYLAQYGCTHWTDEALDAIGRYAPLVELGAGLGHWQRALAERRVDVLSFDNASQLPVPDVRSQPVFVGKVQSGDESVVSKHPKRTLLLVYPGPDAMAANALERYKGDVLLYVGEARGGVNGTPEFFDALAAGWDLVSVHPVDPFPGGRELLWVLKRKGSKGKAKGWLW